MLIGILSDSHDDMQQISRAVDLFNSRAVAHVIHAGDVVSPFTFEVLSSLKAPFQGIFGNNDGDRVLLREKSGHAISIQPLLTSIDNRKFAVIHEPLAMDAHARSGLCDVVIYGHTHIPVIKHEGATLVINPGKTARLHKGKSTVAILDTQTMEAEIIELPVT